MNQCLVLLFICFVYGCASGTKETQPKLFENWKIKETNGITDTTKVESMLPEAELKVVFTHTKDSSTIFPELNFYPIELKEYIGKNLRSYLMLRATLFPPEPIVYETELHVVLGWNLMSYHNYKCIDCDVLREDIIKEYTLKNTRFQKIDW